jgi:UDP-N-acetylglucosamine acyltransferase
MTNHIHPTAIIEGIVGKNCFIGPYCYIGKHVQIGNNCHLFGHCSIGAPPQIIGCEAGNGIVSIGNNVEIREFVTINLPASTKSTVIGDDCYLMASSHVGHDCVLSDHVVVGVGCALSGHTKVGRHTYLGLNVSTHQHANIGSYCMIGANAFFKGTSPDGVTWGGVPAKAIKVNARNIEKNVPVPAHQLEMKWRADEFIQKQKEGC